MKILPHLKRVRFSAEGEIEIERARRRALERLAAEETKSNKLEAIYGKTFQLLNSAVASTTIEQIDDDWIVFHSEKARLVSEGTTCTFVTSP